MNNIALITGATSGIGFATAVGLANSGYDLILVARNEEKAKKLQDKIGGYVRSEFIYCDLSSIASVKKAVAQVREKYTRIDLLVNNAGLISQHRQNSVDNIELTFATNHLGPFILTTGLIDLLRGGEDPRIVHLASEAHFFAFGYKTKTLVNPPRYQDMIIYGRSKLANILFSNELARRLKPLGITSNAVHPGVVASNFADGGDGPTSVFMRLFRPFFKNVTQGSATTLYVATSPALKGVSGQYFTNSRLGRVSSRTSDQALAAELWELSEELVNY